jgi:hypothetical protein
MSKEETVQEQTAEVDHVTIPALIKQGILISELIGAAGPTVETEAMLKDFIANIRSRVKYAKTSEGITATLNYDGGGSPSILNINRMTLIELSKQTLAQFEQALFDRIFDKWKLVLIENSFNIGLVAQFNEFNMFLHTYCNYIILSQKTEEEIMAENYTLGKHLDSLGIIW